MRIAFLLLAIIAYLVSFNLYVANIPNPNYAIEFKKLWYNYTTALLLLYYTIDGWRGYISWLHEQFSRLIMILVLCNFALIISIHSGWLSNPIGCVITYNLFWVLLSVMIFISSWKNGLFK